MKRKFEPIHKLYKLLSVILYATYSYTCYYLSHLFPRKKNIWLFGADQFHFTDNTKYLFLYVAEHCPEIRAIWISRNRALIQELRKKGFEAYHQRSLKGLFFALRGKFYIFHSQLLDINLSASGGTIKVNLWHGAPIKRIRFSTTKKGKIAPLFAPTIKNAFLQPYFFIDSDFILSTSKRVTKYFSEAFRVNESQCMEFGYPRNEILSYPKKNILKFIEKYEPDETIDLVNQLKMFKKVFIYMPTWRDNGRNFIEETRINFTELNEVLEQKGYALLLKLHRYTTISSSSLNNCKHIISVDNSLDIYPILPFTDCLITDYSSIYFDYHLMDKEVILFPFDMDEYLDKDREMYFNYDEVTEEELLVHSFEELLDTIKMDKKSSGIKNTLLKEMILETKGIESSKEIVEKLRSLM